MKKPPFTSLLGKLQRRHSALLARRNPSIPRGTMASTVDTPPRAHRRSRAAGVEVRPEPGTNPFCQERLGINAAFNAGAIEWKGRVLLCVRVEGWDRKSFFAMAESRNGIDGFASGMNPASFPRRTVRIRMSMTCGSCSMRMAGSTGSFAPSDATPRPRPPTNPAPSHSAASCARAISRTGSAFRSRHPLGAAAQCCPAPGVRTRPVRALHAAAGFLYDAGSGGGIGWALCRSLEKPRTGKEEIIDPRVYHTISELKNGQGPAPIKTPEGWLHLAHGVRNTAAGLRYVLYLFLTDLTDPRKTIARPQGYFIAPVGDERIGDVSNVVFSNGWVARKDGSVLIYYASSDTRLHVASSTIPRLLDYVKNTPADGLRSAASVQQRIALIRANRRLDSRKQPDATLPNH